MDLGVVGFRRGRIRRWRSNFGNKTTLTVFIAAKVRLGLTPAVNAVGVALIAATILLAVLYELRRRRAEPARASAGIPQPSS